MDTSGAAFELVAGWKGFSCRGSFDLDSSRIRRIRGVFSGI